MLVTYDHLYICNEKGSIIEMKKTIADDFIALVPETVLLFFGKFEKKHLSVLHLYF